MADDATRVDLELESEVEEATLDLEGDTSQNLDLEVEDKTEECTLNLSDDTANYLDLEFENQIDVVKTGGGGDVGEGTLTITQGGVKKGTFNANSKTDVTIEVDAGGTGEVTKAEFDAEITRAQTAEQENSDAITAETNRATAKESEIETNLTAEVTRATKREDEIDAKFDEYAPLASPAFSGTPTAPTATAGDSTTQLATTAFVTDAVNTAIVEVENGSY